MTRSLYQRLGGAQRIDALAKDVIDLHRVNPALKSRLAQTVDCTELERAVAQYFCADTSAPQSYTGVDVLWAHRKMKFNDQELVTAMDDVRFAMTRNGYRLAVQNDALAIL
jgi:hemoglobin